ncbi:hypothetical protein PSEUBRA_003715 [Kalmanozyma brasiliensis GHG001]|uniref:uncharacterized protein n=1 Tax=Kalmanozyma brasiliensis (strain GHG001) TaxID=1365824 RepID=UPI0028682CBE|nr:uncharacterized protein PSEUBRA_003715 [Kalmanozyma brasiliensis GHG001]KAF6767278.1 hypothetical protein PSEUBRA_003715 [Kalmanozyma brasiliensis GHG001]
MSTQPPPYLPDDLSTASDQQIKHAIMYIIKNRLTDERVLVNGHTVAALLGERNRRRPTERPLRIRDQTGSSSATGTQ